MSVISIGKEIEYINECEWKDGAYYRYYDLMENGLEKRYLDKNDELVKAFSS